MDGFLSAADLCGWIGNVGFVIGALLLAYRKPIISMWLSIFGNTLYIAVGYLTNTPSLWILSVALAAINVVGIINWRRHGQS